jgi:hypothetical protein
MISAKSVKSMAKFSKLDVCGGELRYLGNRIASSVAARVIAYADERNQVAQAVKFLQQDLISGAMVRSGYVDHYDEKNEVAVWKRYQGNLANEDVQSSEVVFRASYVLNQLRHLISQNPDVKRVINIGCSYGWLEGQVAKDFPNINIVGIDRSQVAMNLNREEFCFSNIDFVADDFRLFFERHPEVFSDSIVCHLNFGVYFLPNLLADLYRKAYVGGAKYILVFEPSGISRQTHKHFCYDLNKKNPVVFRGPMLLNNYPAIFDDAGFRTIFSAQLRPPHPHRDFRSVCFIGEKR